MSIHVPVRVTEVVDQARQWAEDWKAFFLRIGRTYGTWTAVPWMNAVYSASAAMTFTVQAADQHTLGYTLMGQRAELAICVRNATVAGVVDTALRITMPGKTEDGRDITPARDCSVPIVVRDNGTRTIGKAVLTAGSTTIGFMKADESNWTASANATDIEGVIPFEVS